MTGAENLNIKDNMNKKIALKNLFDFTRGLDEMGVHYWLEAGTCLGAVREGDFIEHDLDIDIGMNEEEFNFRIVNKMFELGFGVRHIFGMRAKGMEIAFARDGIKIDLFLHYRKGCCRWNAVWLNGGRNGMSDMIPMIFPADLFENQRDQKLNKYIFKVPADAERYLELWYGKDWRIPKKRWDWSSDPPAIKKDFQYE